MIRRLTPEILDALPPGDAQAARARQDLQRLNRIMGHSTRIAERLAQVMRHTDQCVVVELGAGDGETLRRALERWPLRPVRVVLVDRHPVTLTAGYRRMPEVTVEQVTMDVFEWLKVPPVQADLVIANLFVHHFNDVEVRDLFAGVCRITRRFLALEPRRGHLSRFAASRVGWIGCSAVTQHDARVSVEAGFCGEELSTLWPGAGWTFEERRAGWFTHLFHAERRSDG
jgi:hypothetical protein